MEKIDIDIIATNNGDLKILENHTCIAINKLRLTARVTCIFDSDEIQRLKLISTPALLINGEVVSQGKMISSKQIQSILKDFIDLR
ncbi:hypothetical protein AMR41_21675 [Hapalosiphon sp. MRB220]|nr:hypothetical protein AMR41_21675 [Hapalosiphon sp. MRB220]